MTQQLRSLLGYIFFISSLFLLKIYFLLASSDLPINWIVYSFLREFRDLYAIFIELANQYAV